MNTWLKSLLIGVAATALTFFVSQKIAQQNRKPLYTADYTVEIIFDEKMGNSEHIDAMVKLPLVIKSRCEAAGYSATLKPLTDGKELQITIKHVDDTSRAANLITRNSQLEFRELFTLNEIPHFINMFNKGTEDEVTRSPDVIVPADTTKALIIGESPPAPPKKTKEYLLDTLVKFQDALDIKTADLGYVYEKDTALLNKLLQEPTTLEKFPAGIRFYYGPVPYYRGKVTKVFSIYAARRASQEVAKLRNKDVKNARVDYDMNGQPQVLLGFTHSGSRIWELMTKSNIGRHIGMIVDNVVVTAPIVNDVIEGGNSSISGGFSIEEARLLAAQLNAGDIPAKLNIIKQALSPESSGLKLKFILILAGVFVLISVLAWVVFNALKNR